MLVVKAPLRVSFFGGGSDLPSYYNKHDYGLCVSTTINSYIHLAINMCTAKHIKVCYSKLELVDDIEKLQHDRVRECLKLYGIYSNIEICSFTDFTVRGTGLGASSAFTVALIKALHQIKYGEDIKNGELAETAAYIEIEKCGDPIGYQDQYAAAYGGFKQYRFKKEGITVEPVAMEASTKIELQESLLFFNTGMSRHSGEILKEQTEDETFHHSIIRTLVEMAEESLKYLYDHELDNFGRLLDEAWLFKSTLPGVRNEHIDKMYDIAMKAGALGGKILGAGGGGFLMMFVPPDMKMNVKKVMEHNGYERRDFQFSNKGADFDIKRRWISY